MLVHGYHSLPGLVTVLEGCAALRLVGKLLCFAKHNCGKHAHVYNSGLHRPLYHWQGTVQSSKSVKALVTSQSHVCRLLVVVLLLHCRPLSPGGRAQLELCLGAADEAVHVLQRTCTNMVQVASSLPTCTDSYAYRGKICSLLDASATTAAHVQLLLEDAVAVCGSKAHHSGADLQASAQKLQQALTAVNQQLESNSAQLRAALAAKPLSSDRMLNMQLTQLQKQLASTAALDGSLRAVGTAYASLLALSHREGAAVAKQFLQDSSVAGSSVQAPGVSVLAASTPAGMAPATTSKVLKLGDCAMKRLRNGDIYKVKGGSGRNNVGGRPIAKMWGQLGFHWDRPCM